MAGQDYNLGRFNEDAEFLQPIQVETATGERETTYDTSVKRLCEVNDVVLKADESQDALPEEQTLLLKTWNVPGASNGWRVKYENVVYDIIRIDRQLRGVTFYYLRRTDQCNE